MKYWLNCDQKMNIMTETNLNSVSKELIFYLKRNFQICTHFFTYSLTQSLHLSTHTNLPKWSLPIMKTQSRALTCLRKTSQRNLLLTAPVNLQRPTALPRPATTVMCPSHTQPLQDPSSASLTAPSSTTTSCLMTLKIRQIMWKLPSVPQPNHRARPSR